MTETGVGPVGSDLAWRGHESSFSGQPLAASFPTTCKTSESQGGPLGSAKVLPTGCSPQSGSRWCDVPVCALRGRAATRHTSQGQIPEK